VSSLATATRQQLLRRALWLEYATLAWNVVGSLVLLAAAVAVGSLALAGFGVDSLIEIVASAVVIWQLQGTASDARDRRALRIIAIAFVFLALYIAAQAAHTLLAADHPGASRSASRGWPSPSWRWSRSPQPSAPRMAPGAVMATAPDRAQRTSLISTAPAPWPSGSPAPLSRPRMLAT
jgi:hypothetical protein